MLKARPVRFFCVFLVALVSASVGVPQLVEAQDTWGGLRFGISEQAAREVLGEETRRPRNSEKTGIADEYTGWVTTTNFRSCKGHVALIFDEASRTLSAVRISFKAADCRSSVDSKNLAEELNEALVKRYGTPVLIDLGEAVQRRVFRSKGQAIEMTAVGGRLLEPGNGFVALTYEPDHAAGL